MKARFGVTIFSNGEINILKGSLQEDLWQDYCFFLKKVSACRAKDSRKGLLLARRYERAAALSLVAFFHAVINAWLIQQGNGQAADFLVLDKCRCLLRMCGCKKADEAAFSHLFNVLTRYEQNQQAFLENLSRESLEDMQECVCAYLDYLEARTELHRFPVAGNSTKQVVQRLMDGL